MSRTVKGEVVASTFDEHPSRHVQVANMVIEKAFSITILATCTCLLGCSSNVLATTSPLTVLDISVTSSGRSSISKTINSTSGLLLFIE